MDQVTLAAASGLNQATISRLENGVHRPSYETVEALERALRMPRGSLVFGEQVAS